MRTQGERPTRQTYFSCAEKSSLVSSSSHDSSHKCFVAPSLAASVSSTPQSVEHSCQRPLSVGWSGQAPRCRGRAGQDALHTIDGEILEFIVFLQDGRFLRLLFGLQLCGRLLDALVRARRGRHVGGEKGKVEMEMQFLTPVASMRGLGRVFVRGVGYRAGERACGSCAGNNSMNRQREDDIWCGIKPAVTAFLNGQNAFLRRRDRREAVVASQAFRYGSQNGLRPK